MRRTRSPWLPILPFLSNLLRSHMFLAASHTMQGKQGGTGSRQSVGRKVVENNIACFCSHFWFSAWMDSTHGMLVNTLTYPLLPLLFILLPPSSSALCRRMIRKQLAVTKLLRSTLHVARHGRVAVWLGPTGTLSMQVSDELATFTPGKWWQIVAKKGKTEWWRWHVSEWSESFEGWPACI